MISLSRGAGILEVVFDPDCGAAFFLAAAFTGKTPRPLVDIVEDSDSFVDEIEQ